MKLVPGGDNLVNDVQCYELFGGMAFRNHEFIYLFIIVLKSMWNLLRSEALAIPLIAQMLIWYLKSVIPGVLTKKKFVLFLRQRLF